MVNERAGRNKNQQVADQGHQGLNVYSPTQSHFLSRLRKLKAKKEDYKENDSQDPQILRLLDSVLYSTYMDCVRLGVEEEAKAALSSESTGL